MVEYPRSYKDYLHSCSIENVSPRILRRLNYNHRIEPRNLNVHFEENVTSFRRTTKNIETVDCTETSCENKIYPMQEDKNNLNEPIETIKEVEKVPEEKENITDTIKYDESVILKSFKEDCFKIQLVASNVNETQQVIDNHFNDDNHQFYFIQDEYLEFDEDLFFDLLDNEDLNNFRCPNSLQSFMSREDFLNNIDVSVNKSRGEIFFMVLQLVLKFKLSLTEFSNIMRIINLIFSQSILPDSRWILDNILNPKNCLQFHGICPTCCKYVGEIKDLNSFLICEVCLETIDLKSPSCSNIFVLINPAESIKLIIEENQKYYEYVTRVRNHDGPIKDIFDGRYYKSFEKNLPILERHNYATVIFNTDGAPRFESSVYSIWPMYLQLNEIPIEIRLKRIITCGMWFGKNKPEMAAFLQPFTNTMNQLSTEGIKCVISNEERVIKVYALTCCVDSVARAPMQGIQFFNGK